MFYFLSEFRESFFVFNVFRYITFRAGMAAVTTFLISVCFGPFIISYLKNRRIKEIAKRDDCPDLDKFQTSKEGTPTMGGIFIVISILLSVILWGDLTNEYIVLTLVTFCYLAVVGFVDDYIKLKKKRRRKRGMQARVKLFWQFLLGCVIGYIMYGMGGTSPTLTVPFLKSFVIPLGILYIPAVALVIVGSSNAVNVTDGLDGLAIGCVGIVSFTLAILCYLVGHIKFSQYLLIPYVPGAGELTVFCAAMMGASMGFLWFNCHPANVFMGDVGSLALGGSIGVMSAIIKKELLLILLGGVFVIETLSVLLQIFSVKVRRKRIFKVSPLHHHLQLTGWAESKIIVRFWIIGIIFALLTLTTLKIR